MHVKAGDYTKQRKKNNQVRNTIFLNGPLTNPLSGLSVEETQDPLDEAGIADPTIGTPEATSE
jgi:hypothetical protein